MLEYDHFDVTVQHKLLTSLKNLFFGAEMQRYLQPKATLYIIAKKVG